MRRVNFQTVKKRRVHEIWALVFENFRKFAQLQAL